MGSAVALGTNWNNTAGTVGNGTYIAFICLTGIGIFIPMIMADPKKMIRTDGTRVAIILHPSWKSELIGLWVALRTDPYIVLLFPVRLLLVRQISSTDDTRRCSLPRTGSTPGVSPLCCRCRRL
jgi:hypothetical protein